MKNISLTMISNKKLRRIDLDSVKHADYFGISMVALGLITLGFSIVQSLQTAKYLAKANAEVSRNQALVNLNESNIKDIKVDPAQLEIIGKIEKQIKYPWEMFFSSLEATHTSHISLLSIQPNIDKKEALITAEAENVHEMLEFIRVLNVNKSFSHVELLSQEAIVEPQQTNQQDRISFLVMVNLT